MNTEEMISKIKAIAEEKDYCDFALSRLSQPNAMSEFVAFEFSDKDRENESFAVPYPVSIKVIKLLKDHFSVRKEELIIQAQMLMK